MARSKREALQNLMDGTKICSICGDEKELEEFRDLERSRDGKEPHCRTCELEVKRPKRYGMTSTEYRKIKKQQDSKCAICSEALSELDHTPHIDHCHTSGQVRGILCRACNHLLGNAKDNPEILRAAINYLKEETNGKRLRRN